MQITIIILILINKKKKKKLFLKNKLINGSWKM